MASKARKAFDKNATDIERLLEIHSDLGGTAPGRRHRLEVLNKSGVVLISAFWEAYCEDLAAEALAHVVKQTKDSDALSKEMKQLVAKELESHKDQLAVWQLAGDGWRDVLRGRLERLQEARNRRLNTPKSGNIDDLFATALGVKKISSAWYWPGMSIVQSCDKLDRYVELRGEIAHRGAPAAGCSKSQVEDYFDFVKRLVAKTGGRANKHVLEITGQTLW